MATRQSLQPVDLFSAVPKTGVISPARYNDALRQRLGTVGEIGEQQNEFAGQQAVAMDYKRQAAEQAAYQAQLQQRLSAANSAAQRAPGMQGPNGIAQQVISSGKYGYANPLPGITPTGQWGRYASGGEHNALDFAAKGGTPILSPVNGRVAVSGWDNGGFGNSLRIQNEDGRYTILGHMAQLPGVKVGDIIKIGQQLGLVGSTGRSTGNHLHLEMRDKLYDPKTAFNFSDLFKW